MIVMKFGGSSLSSASGIERAVAAAKGIRGERALVVSALDGTTDLLIQAAHDAREGRIDPQPVLDRHASILGDLGLSLDVIEAPYQDLIRDLGHAAGNRHLDGKGFARIVSFGERAAARTVAAAFCKLGAQGFPVNASKIGLTTLPSPCGTWVQPETLPRLARRIPHAPGIPIITGYIGRDREGRVTTLGRNGSDYSASLFASALRCRELRVYKDVPGVLTSAPGLLSRPRLLPSVDYGYARMLSQLGSTLFHPRTLEPLGSREVLLRVLGAKRPEETSGTRVEKSPRSRAGGGATILVRSGLAVKELEPRDWDASRRGSKKGDFVAPSRRLDALLRAAGPRNALLLRRDETMFLAASRATAETILRNLPDRPPRSNESETASFHTRDLLLIACDREPTKQRIKALRERMGIPSFVVNSVLPQRQILAYPLDPKKTRNALATIEEWIA